MSVLENVMHAEVGIDWKTRLQLRTEYRRLSPRGPPAGVSGIR